MKLSIIIPMKNEERDIESCLKSILNNSFPTEEYEIICIDNGSDDRTLELANKLVSRTYQIPLKPISYLRNFGVKKASGQYVAFVDADCEVEKSWMVAASSYFGNNEVVCFGSTPEVSADATWVQKTWFLHKEARDDIQKVEWLESMNLFIRRDVFNEVGGFNEDLETCEDVDLCYRISRKYQIIADKRIKVVHLGEAKNLVEFFKKELWRGKSNLKGLKSHGIALKEIPSVLIPIYYFALPIFYLVLLYLKGFIFSALSFIALSLFPVFSISLHICSKTGKYEYLAKASIVYLVYFVARAISIIY